MICVPITGPSMDDALRDIQKSVSKADLLELRLDLIKDFNLDKLLEATGKKVIVTYRPEREGGVYSGDDKQRIEVLQKAIDKGASHIDIEWDSVERIKKTSSVKLIVSRHFFDGLPGDFEKIIEDMNQMPADIVKSAVTIKKIEENAQIFRILKKQKKQIIMLNQQF